MRKSLRAMAAPPPAKRRPSVPNKKARRPRCGENSGGADAKLFQMIVAADPAHDPKERFRRNENTEAIAQNHQGSRDLKDPCQQKHGKAHRNSGNEPRQETTKPCSGSAHHYLRL